eukprot:3940245-Rhodomonas_salina.4
MHGLWRYGYWHIGYDAMDTNAWAARPNPIQEDTISVQSVLKMRFLVFDFGVLGTDAWAIWRYGYGRICYGATGTDASAMVLRVRTHLLWCYGH